MSKKKDFASFLALIVTVVMVFAPAANAAEIEEEPQKVISQTIDVNPEADYGSVEEKSKNSATEIEFEEVIEQEEISAISEEAEVLGTYEFVSAPLEQDAFLYNDGFSSFVIRVVDDREISQLTKRIIYDKINNKYKIFDDQSQEFAELVFQDYETRIKGGVTTYQPKIVRDEFVPDSDRTEWHDHFCTCITEEAYSNLPDDWFSVDLYQPRKDTQGNYEYYTATGGMFPTKEEVDEAYEIIYNIWVEEQNKSSSSSSAKDSSSSSGKDSSSSSGKDSSSSSGKDSSSSSSGKDSSSSSSGKDSSSSSGKDDSSSSGKDSSSSSAKDNSSSSSKEDSSSSTKDDSSSSTKDDSSSSTKDDSSSSSGKDSSNVTAKTVKAGAASYEVKATKTVTYDGRKHVAVGMKETSKQVADIKVEITRDGKTLEPGSYKLKFKNNTAANGTKKPAYRITLGKGYNKAEKKALSKMDFAFEIDPIKVEAQNFTAKKPATVKNGKLKVKLMYKLPNGKLLTLKKGTYSLSLNGENLTITCKGNLEGTVTIPLKQLQ